MSKIDIAIVNTLPFPSGAASVNRILSYSKGLVELGNRVTVYSTALANDISIHEINGIRYQALRSFSRSKVINSISLIIAFFRLFFILLSSKNNHKMILLVSNSLFLIYPLFIVAKLKGIVLLQEKSEFPFVLNNKSLIGRIYASFYVNTTYKLFDGLVIMTYSLDNYFKKRIRKNCKTIVVPMTVEPERFQVVSENKYGDYIAYCGDIGGNKDGVQNLIASFSMISGQFPEIKLLLIGGSKNPDERSKLEEYVKRINCKNIMFYGTASRDEIPPLLNNAKILALARPSSLQSTGGFPTKLGEYLSTGKPTIVTKVGDIPLYLKDNVNAFLVEPDDNKAFSEKIKFVLDNYENALLVAEKGKKLVYSTFNYKKQAERIEAFLNSFE